jgi:hypothetical protein
MSWQEQENIEKSHVEMQEEMREAQLAPKERALQKVAALDPKQFQVFKDQVDLETSYAYVLLARKERKGLGVQLARYEELSNKQLRALDNTEYDRAYTHVYRITSDLKYHYREGQPDEVEAAMQFIETLKDIRYQVNRGRLQPKTPPQQ